jgi:hypothetical protein
MRIVKSCKKEFNLKLGHNEIWLGSFSYYRNLDPTFSIADHEEGLSEVGIYLDNEILTPDQYNNLFAHGGLSISGKFKKSKLVAGSHLDHSHANLEFLTGNQEGLVRLTIKGNTQKFYCPNSFLLAFSVLEDHEDDIDPASIDKEYNSQYIIRESNIESFINEVVTLIKTQITFGDLHYAFFADKKIIEWESSAQFVGDGRKVEYVKEKKLALNSANDLDRLDLEKLIMHGMFQKNDLYRTDSEFRILFPIHHGNFGVISVNNENHLKLKVEPNSKIFNLVESNIYT